MVSWVTTMLQRVKNETQHHSNNCHGWPYSTPFDQPNFSVHFRLFGLQSHEWQLRFRVFIFEDKWPNDATAPKSAPNSHSLWVHRLLNDVWIFWAPNSTILLIDLIDLLPTESKMYWKIGLIEWGIVRPAVADIWMMLCFILKWKCSIFLIGKTILLKKYP